MPPRPLQIAFLTSEYVVPPDRLGGGLATYVQRAARGLVQRGNRVSVFCLSDRDAVWSDQGVDVHDVGSQLWRPLYGPARIVRPVVETRRSINNSVTLAKRLLAEHELLPLDVVQAASYEAVGIALCGNGGVPLVSRISSAPWLYRKAEGRRVSPLSPLVDWGERYQIRHSDQSFAPSELMVRAYSAARMPVPLLIRSPVDPQPEAQDESFYRSHLQGANYLLFFGALNKMKGIEVLSRAIGPLLQEFPDLHVVCIGKDYPATGKATFADMLLRQNARWGQRVRYFSSLPKEQLYPAISNAHGVLIPSLINNYPNTCLEAMQFGRIVVGTFGSSLEEMIVDGETGFLVKRGDVEDLQRGIRRLLHMTPTEKAEMEMRIHRAFKVMVAEDRIGQLLDFYRAVIQQFADASHRRPRAAAGLPPRVASPFKLWARILGEAGR
jgi:glycosyltransferase involved in cell wall biosynthesis